MDSFLITGGAGFVGSNLVLELLSRKDVSSIVVVDNFLSSEKEELPDHPKLQILEGSIADDSILKEIEDQFDYIFHLACYHGNQSSIANPLEDHQNNALTTLKLFEHVKSFKRLKKIVYSGAGCAVSDKNTYEAKATLEKDVVSLDMDSPYSISKVLGEFYAKYYYKQHGLKIVRARFQNVFGPREILGAGKWRGTKATVWRNVVPTFIYKAIKGESLPLENGGESSRDFIFVKDIVEGLLALAFKGSPNEAYNLASGQEVTILELASLINELTENKSPLLFLPKREWDTSIKRFGCSQKSYRDLEFKAKTSLNAGLKDTIDWFHENFDKIEKTMRKHLNQMPELNAYLSLAQL